MWNLFKTESGGETRYKYKNNNIGVNYEILSGLSGNGKIPNIFNIFILLFNKDHEIGNDINKLKEF